MTTMRDLFDPFHPLGTHMKVDNCCRKMKSLRKGETLKGKQTEIFVNKQHCELALRRT